MLDNIWQYFYWRREDINSLIEEAILKADTNGVKVLSLGLLNQASGYLTLQIS